MNKIRCPYLTIKSVPNGREIPLEIQPYNNHVEIYVLTTLRDIAARIYKYEVRYHEDGSIKLYIPYTEVAHKEVLIKYDRELDLEQVDYAPGVKSMELYKIYFSDKS